MGQDGTREIGRRSVVSVMNWIGTLIVVALPAVLGGLFINFWLVAAVLGGTLPLYVLAIPAINIIMLFVWAITCKRASKRNFCVAVLVLSLILIALSLAVVALYGTVIATWLEGLDAKWLLNPQALISATPAPTVAP